MADKPGQQLSFVTATKLEQFKDKRVMQKVRKAVMRDYLTKAKDDPQSNDVRAKKRESPTPVKSEVKTPTLASPSTSFRRDSHTSFERQASSYPASTTSRPSSVVSSSGSTHSDHAINPMIPPTPNQEWLFEVADDLNKKAAQPGLEPDRTNFEAILAPGSQITAQKMEFLVAFTRGTSQKAKPDIFAQHAALPNTVDLDRLKINCATYFGSAGMSDQWLPLMLLTPQSFLASLCVSAPYTDLMTAAYRGDDLSKYSEARQTLEILDILPRMINDALTEHGCSDGNITSVIQLLLGQLATPYTGLIGSHQSALKRMVAERGGLDKLGGKGVLAMSLSLINAEANILRSEPVDEQYLTWISTYLEKNKTCKLPGPEGPLLWVSRGMMDVQRSPLCRPETFELIKLMYELNERVLRLQRLEDNENAGNMDVIILQSSEKALIRDRIRDIVLQVHDMPRCHQLNPTGSPDWIYETVRLSSVLFSHAVYHRRPLHHTVKCSLGHNCHVTPEMVQEAVQQTHLRPVWDHLAGVLYWALMIAAASCHDPVGETYDMDTPAVDTSSLSSPSTARSASAQERPATVPPVMSAPTMSPLSTVMPPPAPTSAPPTETESTQRQQAFIFAANQWSTSKRLFEEYTVSRDTDVVGGLMSGMNISEGQPAASSTVTAGAESPRSVPLYYRDVGFVSMGPPATPSPKEEGKRQRREERASFDEVESKKQKEKRAYVKRYLTANAVRVSSLLRFEHTAATTASIQRLEEVTRWLARR
ncbi:Hypothetical protein D9617_2g058660 [Elsinoe fawcettii]|nr:Hypothetical protein D9617_2g058660 [Elsinoe fawcettii]